ncbi:MAG: hypothetical protein COB34_05725 [Methylophilaceae bacterium]|nr:MAG: hypothetical protein COB34_05725 [Methylophilaceae bacterium]
MKLHKVQIRNFRSIEDEEIVFDPKCRILVGINESGKSNVLKALNLLSDTEPSSKDIRYELEEEAIEEAFVEFHFTLDEKDKKQFASSIQQKILVHSSSEKSLFTKSGKKHTLQQVCNLQLTALYQANIVDEVKRGRYFTYPTQGFSVPTGWKKPTDDCPKALNIIDQDQQSIQLNSLSIIAPEIERDPSIEEFLTDVTADDISSLIGSAVVDYVFQNIPKCVYWNYKDENILPAKIIKADFIADPTICKPLESMFELAGIHDIEAEFDKKKARPHGDRALLEKVAKAATKHIKSIWKEYKAIEISLHPNGDFIDAGIKDKTNIFDFASRSDGFKRFVSFLLMVSAKVKTKNIQNTLVLIDEPEIGIHPSGAKHLLAELLKISDENYVIFSTHSIFMIDKEKINRHLIIEKNNEKTTLKEVTESNFQDEEVIYNALGHSVFEVIQEKNILFEGWKDKKLFQIAMSKIPTSHSQLKNKFENVGIAHLQGVKRASDVATLLDLANRKYLILSDDDNPAKEAQKRFTGSMGIWRRYSEILPTSTFVTGEDFIKSNAALKVLNKLKIEYPDIGDPVEADITGVQGKIEAIKRYLSRQRINQNLRDEIIKKFKENLTENLKPADIEDGYYELLEEIDLDSL